MNLVTRLIQISVIESDHVRNEECGFEGNSDLYGLGIRLGVYFQWLSTLIVYGWYPEGRNELAEAYIIFVTAITITMIVATARAEPTHAVEILILTYIIFGGLITVSTIGFRKSHQKRIKLPSLEHFLAWTAVWGAAGIYCSWFWLKGIYSSFLETPCGTFAFIFAKVSLYNSSLIRFFAALSVILGSSNTIYILFAAMTAVLLYLDIDLPEPVAQELRGFSGYSNNEAQPTGGETANVYTIDSTGQLIPLIIGVVGLVRVSYISIRTWYKERQSVFMTNRDTRSDSEVAVPGF
ncbi:beta-ketoacyl synthase [Fusarium beomiforme]|uniref:Beta-ketoacyl synthase n=1 Tax=Fusarium beomiforme TaxID=44412 RepID=A0A9P5AD33_9HYPO|nr:beta-ketoacyl synthase [Fusarium beomiforme]